MTINFEDFDFKTCDLPNKTFSTIYTDFKINNIFNNINISKINKKKLKKIFNYDKDKLIKKIKIKIENTDIISDYKENERIISTSKEKILIIFNIKNLRRLLIEHTMRGFVLIDLNNFNEEYIYLLKYITFFDCICIDIYNLSLGKFWIFGTFSNITKYYLTNYVNYRYSLKLITYINYYTIFTQLINENIDNKEELLKIINNFKNI